MSERTTCLRVARPEDAEALLGIYAPYVERTAISFEYEVPSLAEFRGRIENTLTRYPYLVATDAQEILGYAYTGPFHTRAAYGWAAETTIYLKEGRKGKGLGRLLYQALEAVSKAQHVLSLNACIGYPETEDEYLTKNSAQFHAHMGYDMVGEIRQCGYKFGRWYGIVWMEKAIGEHTAPPPAFIPFPSLAPDTLPSLGISR